MRKFNIALLGKWRWELFHQNGQLWTRILNSKYGGWRNLDEERNSSLHSHCWKDLRQLNQIEESIKIKDQIEWKVRCGDMTRFWEDKWLGGTEL